MFVNVSKMKYLIIGTFILCIIILCILIYIINIKTFDILTEGFAINAPSYVPPDFKKSRTRKIITGWIPQYKDITDEEGSNFALDLDTDIHKLQDSDINIPESNKCNKFFTPNSYCQLNIDNNKCSCKFQKDDIKYTFTSPEPCCERDCQKRTPEECVKRNDFSKMPYYCNIGGKCVQYEGTIISSHIAANNCGTDMLNNQLLLPYADKEECLRTIDICDKYNIPDRSARVNRDECLKDVNCGYCSNEENKGKCISGTISGPQNLQKYFFCTPYQKDGQNNYEYGNHVAYLLQPPPPN